MTPGHIARIEAGLREQEARERSRPVRAEIAKAIARADVGDDVSVLELDLSDPHTPRPSTKP